MKHTGSLTVWPYMLRPMPTWNPEWASGSCPVPSENIPLSAGLRRRPCGSPVRSPPLPGAGRSRPFVTHCQRTFSAPQTALFRHQVTQDQHLPLVPDEGQRGLYGTGRKFVLCFCFDHFNPSKNIFSSAKLPKTQ